MPSSSSLPRLLLSCLFVLSLCIVVAATEDHYDNHQHDEIMTSDTHELLGVDASWPMHRYTNLHPSEEERERRSRRYHTFMDKCAIYYSETECQESDKERMSMIRRQPPKLQNYTSAGYAKLNAPTGVFDMLKDFYDTNLHSMVRENWPPGNIYTNHWASATKLLPLAGLPHHDDSALQHNQPQPSLSTAQRNSIIAELQPILESWCKMPLLPTSLYGIRMYQRGAVLASHVDRLPLVISVIINVAQSSMITDWPLEVIDHSGTAINVTLQPGEMLLYEGASIIHGRPYPLAGQSYANVFLHFEPVGHSERHMHLRRDPQQLFDEAIQQQQQERSKVELHNNINDDDAPKKKHPYYVPYKKTDAWDQNYVYVKKSSKRNNSNKKGSNKYHKKGGSLSHTGATDNTEEEDSSFFYDNDASEDRLFHNLAAKGSLMRIKEMVMENSDIITKPDGNGWTALHEAARGGHTEVVAYLCSLMDQTEINTRTNGGKGATALWWALHTFDEDHPTVKALLKHGAKSIGPHA